MNFFAIFLIVCVIFVNGWTDAPNAIVSCVCTKTLSMKKAVLLASVSNFLGVFLTGLINKSVAKNIFEMTSITDDRAICAALLSVVILAVVAWAFGIPTSESHAIISALIGSAVAIKSYIQVRTIIYTVIGLFLSIFIGFSLGYYFYCYYKKRRMSGKKAKILQIIGSIIMAFMHGAQDGQKFISILLLIIGIDGVFTIPLWASVFCSLIMAAGTMAGGGRIIKKVGQTMVDMNLMQGISADISGGISLFISTVLGLPVSTSHVKTSAVMGCGFVDGKIDKKAASEILAAWIITFPACFGMGYLFTLIFKTFL